MISTLQDLLTSFLLSTAETLILHQLLISFLTRKKISSQKYFLGFFSYFIFQMITYLYACPLFSTALYYFVFTVLLAFIFFNENIEVKIIISSLFVILNYACKIFGALIASVAQSLLIPALPHELILNARAEIAACFLFLICVRIIIYFRYLRHQNKLLAYTIIVYVIPAGILYLTTNLFLHRFFTFNALFYLEIGGILFFTSIALFYLLDKTVVINESSEKSAMMEHLMQIQEDYYHKLETSQKEIASMRHDIKNHIGCIHSLLDMNQHNEAKEYISHLYAKSTTLSSPIQSGNVMVDIILNQSSTKIATHNIQLKVNAILPPILPINNVDLCILLGNLLDNAMEACNRIDDSSTKRFVYVNIHIRKNMLYIKVANSFNGIIHKKNDTYHTVKKGQYRYGIGLSNIYKVINKYHGESSISYTEQVFTVVVLLGLDILDS